MGLKIAPEVNAVPVEIINGELACDLGAYVLRTTIPALSRYVFNKQCTHFICNNVMCFLTNEKFGVILRYDGTGTLYLIEDTILLKSFVYEMPAIKMYGPIPGGTCVDINERNEIEKPTPIELYYVGDKHAILSCARPLSGIVSMEDNPLYFGEPGFGKLAGHPKMKWDKRNKKLVTLDGNNKPLLEIKGTFTVNRGIAIL